MPGKSRKQQKQRDMMRRPLCNQLVPAFSQGSFARLQCFDVLYEDDEAGEGCRLTQLLVTSCQPDVHTHTYLSFSQRFTFPGREKQN